MRGFLWQKIASFPAKEILSAKQLAPLGKSKAKTLQWQDDFKVALF